jgi:20S proteasome subunit alpha 5
MSRPFGVAVLIAGVDEHGPQLFQTDPSGTFVQFKAKAIGAGSEGAQTELQDHYKDDMTLEEATVLALRVLRTVMEEKLNAANIQVAVVTADKGFHVYSDDETKAAVDGLLASSAAAGDVSLSNL